MVLVKLPVPGRPTIWMIVGQGPIVLAVGAGCLDIFTLLYVFSSISLSLWETARYRLKYCLKGPLSPCPTVIKIVGRPGTGSLPSTIAPPDPPPPPPYHRRRHIGMGDTSILIPVQGIIDFPILSSFYQHSFESPKSFKVRYGGKLVIRLADSMFFPRYHISSNCRISSKMTTSQTD